ncbi:MAG: zf-HC2 domain-containing protein [Pirellulaceae bacterium]
MQFNEEMLSAYLDDELTDEERQVVEEATSGDAHLARLLDDLRQTRNLLKALPMLSPASDPVAGVRSRIDRQKELPSIASSSHLGSSNSAAWGQLAFWATAACLLLAVGSYLLRPDGVLNHQPAVDQMADRQQPRDPQIAEEKKGLPAPDSIVETEPLDKAKEPEALQTEAFQLTDPGQIAAESNRAEHPQLRDSNGQMEQLQIPAERDKNERAGGPGDTTDNLPPKRGPD